MRGLEGPVFSQAAVGVGVGVGRVGPSRPGERDSELECARAGFLFCVVLR